MKTKIEKEIGAKLKQLREQSGITQMDLAMKLGYETPQFVSNIERCASKLPPVVLGKLARILKFNPYPFIDQMTLVKKEKMTEQMKRGLRGVR